MKRPAKKSTTVSATELAKLAVCEQQLVFDKQRGRRLSKEQKEAIALGQQEHAEHHQQVQYMKQLQDKRCFIATTVFGPDAVQTRQLRDFRDAVLMRSTPGRCLIHGYYRYSPAIARWLQHKPLLKFLLRQFLTGIVLLLQRPDKSSSC
jgi:hypothetical protein